MKKEQIKTVSIVILVLVLVIGGSFFTSLLSGKGTLAATYGMQTMEEKIPENEQGDLIEIGIEEYLSLKAGSDLAIIYIARPTCGFCQQQEPVMKHLVYLHDLPVYYLNTDTLDEEGFKKLLSSDESFGSKFGTPLTLLVKNDIIIDRASGYHTKAELSQFFQRNGLIPE